MNPQNASGWEEHLSGHASAQPRVIYVYGISGDSKETEL